MKGTLLQIIAYGAEDLYLKQDPEITFFKKVYKQHTVFSLESVDMTFIDTPMFNNMSVITVKKNADLVSAMFLEVTLPHDIYLTDSYWTNRVGFNLMKKVELYIGKNLIDRIYGLWCHIWIELTHKFDKKNIIDRLVGSMGTNGNTNGLNCSQPHTLTIPLLFSFCRHRELSIPLVAIRDNNDITLKIYFEKKEKCIQTGALPSGNISNVKLWVDYIYLEKLEKLNIIQRPIEYLIEVTQHLERNLISRGIKSIGLPFTLPCKELTWVVRNIKPIGDKFTDFTFNNTSMVNNVQFKFNSKNVFSSGPRKNEYFNYIVPYQHHSGSPDLGINAYSFSLYPEDLSPSGIIKFSHVKTPFINIGTNGNGIFHIFAHSYNIMRIENGKVSIIYKY